MEGNWSRLLNLLLLLLSPTAFAAGVADTLGKGGNITGEGTLVSANGTFTMGFFSLGPSTNRKRYYLGIWFSVSRDAVCWVANSERPLPDKTGALVLSDTGSLLLLDGSGQVAWSSNSPIASSSSVEAQLLETGNLVVGAQGSSSSFLWKSFDHPSDTLLPGMKVGKSQWTGAEWYLTSWRSPDDPSTGVYRCVLDSSGLLDFFVWEGNAKVYRTGPWNGRWFSGVPEERYADFVTFEVSTGVGETSYGYVAKPGTPQSRFMVSDTGIVRHLFWDASRRDWDVFLEGPRGSCDVYGRCGAFGLCNVNAVPFCNCLEGFSNTSGGCQRNVVLDCEAGGTTDNFRLVPGVKLPDTHNASVDMSITVEGCRARCLANCSCLAYAAADIRGGGSGCVIWTDAIIDLRNVDLGQDLYLKLAGSEFDKARRLKSPVVTVIAPVASTVAIVLLLLMIWWIRRQTLTDDVHQDPAMALPLKEDPSMTVRLFDLPTIKKATGDFSESYVIGRGRFAVVYKVHPSSARCCRSV